MMPRPPPPPLLVLLSLLLFLCAYGSLLYCVFLPRLLDATSAWRPPPRLGVKSRDPYPTGAARDFAPAILKKSEKKKELPGIKGARSSERDSKERR